MVTLIRGGAAILTSLVLLAACAPGSGTSVTEPQLSSGARCYTSSDPANCRFAHDLAGGYPLQFHTGGR